MVQRRGDNVNSKHCKEDVQWTGWFRWTVCRAGLRKIQSRSAGTPVASSRGTRQAPSHRWWAALGSSQVARRASVDLWPRRRSLTTQLRKQFAARENRHSTRSHQLGLWLFPQFLQPVADIDLGPLAQRLTFCQEQKQNSVNVASTPAQPPGTLFHQTFMTELIRVHSGNNSIMYFLIVLTTDYCWRSWTSRIADWLIDWLILGDHCFKAIVSACSLLDKLHALLVYCFECCLGEIHELMCEPRMMVFGIIDRNNKVGR